MKKKGRGKSKDPPARAKSQKKIAALPISLTQPEEQTMVSARPKLSQEAPREEKIDEVDRALFMKAAKTSLDSTFLRIG